MVHGPIAQPIVMPPGLADGHGLPTNHGPPRRALPTVANDQLSPQQLQVPQMQQLQPQQLQWMIEQLMQVQVAQQQSSAVAVDD